MSRRAATVTQADIARILRAARQERAVEVEVRLGDRAAVVIRLSPSTAHDVTAVEEDAVVI